MLWFEANFGVKYELENDVFRPRKKGKTIDDIGQIRKNQWFCVSNKGTIEY